GDDVLQVLVLLENGFDRARHVVVLVPHNARVEDAGRRRQRVDGRIDPELDDLAGKHGRRVQVRERGGRRGIGQVVGRDVNGLHGGDRTLLGRGDALLQLTHFRGQVGLVAYRRGHAAKQRRNFRARLRESKDVVDEQQDVLPLDIAEVLGHGEARQAHAQPRAGRFGHLAVDERGLRPLGIAWRNHSRFGHLNPEVVTLAGALTYAREDRNATMFLGDVIDQFHDDDRLADAGAAEQARFPALQIRLDQVDHFETGLEHLELRVLFIEL